MHIVGTIDPNKYLQEQAKMTEAYLKAEIDYSIGACKETINVDIEKAYKLRNGEKDLNDYKYLYEAYGIEFPGKLAHIPIMKVMFDALLGIEESDPLNFTLTVMNKEAIDHINDFKRKKILGEIYTFSEEQIRRSMEDVYSGNGQKRINREEEKIILDKAINSIKEKYNDDFKTDLQIYGTDMMLHLMEVLKLKLYFNIMFDDLITTGSEFYQVEQRGKGMRPIFRAIHPKDIYFNKPRNRKFINELDRVVLRDRMTIAEVLSLYGDKLTREEIKELVEEHVENIASNVDIYDMRYMDKLIKGVGAQGYEKLNATFVDVFYVEWKANTEVEYDEPRLVVDSKKSEEIIKREKHKGYRLDLFSGVRIGENKYVDMGRKKDVYRPADAPWDIKLTVNGSLYSDRNGKPFSLVLSTEAISEKYDVLHYHWESLIAMAGGKAVLVDFADIPTWMGKTNMQRTMKWLGMLKQGVGVIDTSQTRSSQRQFNNMGDVDLSLTNSLDTITNLMRYIEELGSRITGVNRQMLGQMMERDGKATSEMAISNASIVTRPLFFLHKEVCKQAMKDILNASRVAYKDGFSGSYLLGKYGQKIFTLDGSKFAMSDYNIHLTDWEDEKAKLQEIKALSIEFIKQQMVDAEDALDMNTINSVGRLVQHMKNSVRRKKEDTTQQMESELEQAGQEIDKLSQVIEKLKGQVEQADQAELQLKAKDIEMKAKLKERELSDKKEIEEKKLKNDSKRIELESLQLHLGGNKNMEVRNK